MLKLFLLILFFIGHFVHGQTVTPTKSKLLRALTKHTKLKGQVYNSTNWFTVGTDSTYKCADTVIFYNSSRYQYGRHICNYIDWNFYKKDAFWVQYLEICREPTTGTLITDQTFFTFKISGSKHPIILNVYNKNVLVDEFEVISLTEQPITNQDKETTDVLILRRIKKNTVEH